MGSWTLLVRPAKEAQDVCAAQPRLPTAQRAQERSAGAGFSSEALCLALLASGLAYGLGAPSGTRAMRYLLGRVLWT